MAKIVLVQRTKLTETDIGISLNLALEHAWKISKVLNKSMIPTITELDNFYKETLLSKVPKGISIIEIGRALTASYKGVIDSAFNDTFYVMNKEAKDPKDLFTKIERDDITMEMILSQITFIFKNALKKKLM
jgi:hypothetical protein